MKKNLVHTFTIAGAMLFFSSCATLLSPNKPGTDGVYIISNTPDAQVYDAKNRLIGTTPLKYSLPSGESSSTLTIEKENYSSSTVTIERKEKAGLAFLDAMLLCIPCIVDYPTGNIYQYNKDSVNLTLKRIYKEDVDRVTFLIQDAEFKAMQEGSMIGHDGKEPIYFKKSTYNTYMYKSEICGLAKESRYFVANCNSSDDKDNSIMLNANTIQVTPQFRKIDIKVKKENGEYSRSVDLEVTWVFAKRSGVTVKTIDASYTGNGQSLENKVLIARTLGAGFAELMDNDENYNLFISESKNTAEPLSKFDEIKVKKAVTPEFKKNKEMIQFLMRGVVTIKHDDGHGSGYFISKDGYLITNYHVVKNKKLVKVQLNESVTLAADVIRFDERYDVALLKVNGEDFNALEMINSDSAQTGDDVIAIGTPEDISLGQSVTKGIISGKRKIAEKVFLQTDVTINSGNSGGPLLNENGGIIGMVTMKLVGKGVEGIGFCVPTNTIIEALNLKYIKQ
jgi:serine protease Do